VNYAGLTGLLPNIRMCVLPTGSQEYPVLWLRNTTRIGAYYILRELLLPEGMVLTIQNAPSMKGLRLRMRYNEAIDEEIDPLSEVCIRWIQ